MVVWCRFTSGFAYLAKKKNVQPGYTHQPFGDIYTIKADAALLFTGQVVNLCVV